jgi:hypothetical protein
MTILLSNIDLVPACHIAASSLRDLIQVLPEKILADVAISVYTFRQKKNQCVALGPVVPGR